MKFSASSRPIASVYDVIGDIHGHASALETLLRTLGYRRSGGGWHDPTGMRTVLFVGDIIDRGPEIRRAVDIVRNMVDAGNAICVMGNHEYNALAWHTPDGAGGWLRSHTDEHLRQHAATLSAYRDDPGGLSDLLDWIRTLPLFYEDGALRVVHAAWDEPAIDEIRHDPRPVAQTDYLRVSMVPGRRESEIVERLLKGVEIRLPDGAVYHDKEGTPRTKTRTRWWLNADERTVGDGGRLTMGDVAMPPADTELADVPVDPEELEHLPGYRDHRPVFVGHYWLSGTPAPLTDRIACLDYSIATGGRLCAYRFDGELPLTANRFVCVPG